LKARTEPFTRISDAAPADNAPEGSHSDGVPWPSCRRGAGGRLRSATHHLRRSRTAAERLIPSTKNKAARCAPPSFAGT